VADQEIKPSAFLESRIAKISRQIEESEVPSGQLYIAREDLEFVSREFRQNEITAEDVCLQAIGIYWANQKLLRSSTLRMDMASLPVDFGLLTNVGLEKIREWWNDAEAKAPKLSKRK
jgi:hypothetical protein